ncbi:MAG: NAD(P)(+) transhydrogenase (Re/Si-specific) subunit beta [Phycisphaerales bacterium]
MGETPVQILLYLFAAILFILGIRGLTHPRTAVRGNVLGALGMLVAIVATLVFEGVLRWEWIVAGLAIGSLGGAILAVRVPMTAMPEMVAALNGFGGGASFLVAGAFLHQSEGPVAMVASAASGLIGAATLSGSAVAFVKLRESKWIDRLTLPGHQVFTGVLAAASLAACGWLVGGGGDLAYWLIVAAGLVLGVMVTTPIGGADMPVVISLLNSYSGVAAAATGFVLGNTLLIVAGSLVGASGLILTRIMCVAMNRSLANVLFGKMAPAGAKADADAVYAGKVKSTSPEEVAMLLDGAQKVLVVPGYGLAVAQAQHVVRDLANELEARGTIVEYGIHPVAGRMPGHMNVLLAEADVPYPKLKEMDEVNASMGEVDVALVIGANDVVNPEARTNPQSPIAGMPVIDVDKAKTVVVVKRSLSPGFAGIPNPLFAADNCLMLFGDGKKALVELAAAVKAG